MSHARERRASGVVEAEAVGAHVARDDGDPPRHLLVEAFAEDLAELVERVVAQDLALHPLRGRGATAARTSSTREQSGTARSSRSTTAVPRKPVDPVTAMRRPARACPIIAPFLPIGRGPVYQLVDRPTAAAVPSRTWPRATGSSTARSVRSARGDTRPARSMRSPQSSGCASRPSCTTSRLKEALLEAVIDRSADELSAVLEDALVRAGEGWDRVEAVVRSVFRLALRRPELLGLLREVSRLGPPAATRLTEALDPLVQRARLFLEAEMDDGHDAAPGRAARAALRVLGGDRRGDGGRGAPRGRHRPDAALTRGPPARAARLPALALLVEAPTPRRRSSAAPERSGRRRTRVLGRGRRLGGRRRLGRGGRLGGGRRLGGGGRVGRRRRDARRRPIVVVAWVVRRRRSASSWSSVRHGRSS